MLFTVTVRRSIEVDVQVEAASAEEAAELVTDASYPLPDRADWSGIKDWWFRVYDRNGELLHEIES